MFPLDHANALLKWTFENLLDTVKLSALILLQCSLIKNNTSCIRIIINVEYEQITPPLSSAGKACSQFKVKVQIIIVTGKGRTPYLNRVCMRSSFAIHFSSRPQIYIVF